MYLNHDDPFMGQHAKGMKEAIDTDHADWASYFPFNVLPGHMVPYGPMVRLYAPLADADPELAAWLARRPTVLANLGTYATYDGRHALDLLLRAAEKQGKPLQVL
ncbi:UDP-glucoronosyl and UDP-glucosyl transferase family protein, partial [Metarhizium majus ARSEF 297]